MTRDNVNKVTGIGGIFFKCQDPKKMSNWYKEQLGLVTNEYGSLFEFRSSDQPQQKAYLQWSPFPENTDYFRPGDQSFMINYRVDDLQGLMEVLRKDGIEVLGDIEEYDYGKFGWIIDPDGNKIELWEPGDDHILET